MRFMADVAYKTGELEQIEIRTRGREKITTAYVRVGTQMQTESGGNIAGISGHKGYTWIGHDGDGDMFRNITNCKWDFDPIK